MTFNGVTWNFSRIGACSLCFVCILSNFDQLSINLVWCVNDSFTNSILLSDRFIHFTDARRDFANFLFNKTMRRHKNIHLTRWKLHYVKTRDTWLEIHLNVVYLSMSHLFWSLQINNGSHWVKYLVNKDDLTNKIEINTK